MNRPSPRRIHQALKELRMLPGVGPSIAQDLYDLGIRSAKELSRKDPERLYARLCEQQARVLDRCVLYVFRCAIYAARTPSPKQELLLWWNWKDRQLPKRRKRTVSVG